VKENSNVRQDH